jgi:hypothetical protein
MSASASASDFILIIEDEEITYDEHKLTPIPDPDIPRLLAKSGAIESKLVRRPPHVLVYADIDRCPDLDRLQGLVVIGLDGSAACSII